MSTQELPVFRVEEDTIGTAAVVHLHGELDIHYEPDVVAGFERALARKPSALAADLRGLTFMDSTGVHALIDTEARCRQQGARFFVICGSGAVVDRVLSVLGLDRLFEILSAPEQLAVEATGLSAVA